MRRVFCDLVSATEPLAQNLCALDNTLTSLWVLIYVVGTSDVTNITSSDI